MQYPAERDVLKVTWLHKMMTQVAEFLMWLKLHSHKKNCEAISDACLHLLHVGLFTRPSLNNVLVSDSVLLAALSLF